MTSDPTRRGGGFEPAGRVLGARGPVADPDWPFLTAAQATRIRQQAREAAARRGITATVSGPYLHVHGDDTEYPLDNLARTCKQASEDQWPEIVDAHIAVTGVLNASDDPEPGIPPGRPLLRLLDEDSLPWELRYARPVTDGLVEAIAIDQPETVAILSDRQLAGADLAALRATARANLLAEPVDYERIEQSDGTVVHWVDGGSMFVASKALVLPELMRDVAGIQPPPDGVLVIVPTRHQLVFHPILDETMSDALKTLAGCAAEIHADRPGPLSPWVYWWRHGELSRLASLVDHEEIGIVDPDFVDVLNRLCG